MTGGWRYILTARAQRDMRRLSHETRQRVFDALDSYISGRRGDVQKLRGVDAEWQLRVGEHRVRFTLDEERRLMIVLRVLPRDIAYRD